MGDITDMPGIAVNTGASTLVSETLDTGDILDQAQQSFDDALDDGSELNESQAPETRREIRRSLNRLQESSKTAAASGSGSGTESADASHGSSVLLTADRPAEAGVDGRHRREATTPGAGKGGERSRDPLHASPNIAAASGSSSGTESADASRNSSVRLTADQPAEAGVGGRHRREATTPGAGKGGERSHDSLHASPKAVGAQESNGAAPPDASFASAAGRAAGEPTAESAGNGPARSGGAGRSTGSGGNDPVSAQDRTQRDDPSSQPAGNEGNQGSRPSATPLTHQGVAAANRMQAGATAAGDSVPGRQRAGLAGRATAARTTPALGPQTGRMQAAGRPAASRTERAVSRRGSDDAHVSDDAAIDMTGTAAFAGIAESGQATTPEVVQAPTSRAAELAEQVADRILVSMPESGAPGEVRISLKQSILDGSDVRIFHEGGDLKVVFVAETVSAQRFLADNRAFMQQTLGERLQGQSVQVEVEVPNRGETSREDSRGRSRQQYVREDDASDAS